MLAAAKLKGNCYPQRILLWGVQPELTQISLDLSPSAELRVENTLEQFQVWGHTLKFARSIMTWSLSFCEQKLGF